MLEKMFFRAIRLVTDVLMTVIMVVMTVMVAVVMTVMTAKVSFLPKNLQNASLES